MLNRKNITILKIIITEYWSHAKYSTLLIIFGTIFGALSAMIGPYLFSRAIDDLANGPNREAALQILLLASVFFGCAKAFGQGARYLIFLCAERLTLIANKTFFAKLLDKSSYFFIEHNAAEIGTACQQGTQTLNIISQVMLGSILPGCVQIGVSAIIIGGLVSWDIALVVILYGVSVVVLDYTRVTMVQPTFNMAVDGSQANANLIGNAVAVVETLRQTRSERWMIERFAESAEKVFGNWRRYALISTGFSGLLGVAAALQLVVTFFILIPRYKIGLISIGDIVLFNTMLIQLNEPFHLIGVAIKELAEATARFKPLEAMWNAPEEKELAESIRYQPSEGFIAFENVKFQYPNSRGVSDISFIARRGRLTFITGETGVGKSTVLRLLLKGLVPVEGRILVDGVDLACVSRQDWLGNIGVVPQDVALINDCIAANIALGRPLCPERLRSAAAQASILARIDEMQDGFDTVVGERGFKLSGGERQRIAIARALYADPTYLILDEASSALDEETESQIMDNIRDIGKNLTIIAVTHRTSMIRPEDVIVCLK
ncbi:ABC transporter ATP-binding protein [Methylorubrum thiocyanatum]|uniref:ABC transporter ATP-binding protein n=1 Tax=Methylorubrum thiocyanatum TaxID=47958 RepID=UPI003F7E2077